MSLTLCQFSKKNLIWNFLWNVLNFISFLDPERQANGSYTITFFVSCHKKFLHVTKISSCHKNFSWHKNFSCLSHKICFVLISLLVGHTKFILRSPGVAGMSGGAPPTSLTNLMRGICKRRALAPCDFSMKQNHFKYCKISKKFLWFFLEWWKIENLIWFCYVWNDSTS